LPEKFDQKLKVTLLPDSESLIRVFSMGFSQSPNPYQIS